MYWSPMSKCWPVLEITSYLIVLQYVHDYLQCQKGRPTIGPCYIVCARAMQSLKYGVRHLLRVEFRGTDHSLEPECVS